MGEKRGKIEREKKEERESRNSRERGSTFFLDFVVIGSSNSGETRGKVCDVPKPGVPLTKRQPTENLYVSYYETHT